MKISDSVFEFAAGERIHTEYSHKYTVEGFAKMAKTAGLSKECVWSDARGYFAVMLLSVDA